MATVHTPEVQETRTDGTMTKELHELGRWLEALGVTHVAMESTGPYWKPVYNILEKFGFELLVCNAQPIKAVPGRKADDVHDAAWLCDLLRHGLLRPSFVPSREQRELRELVRYRRALIRERARELNRIQKVLEVTSRQVVEKSCPLRVGLIRQPAPSVLPNSRVAESPHGVGSHRSWPWTPG
ncbi:transposase [Thermaerobacter sp. FW80]|uniref:IS110 family transposase n=1 Tax=Thermaerobacter sp. FW80 TaxID=2546351 RepID=UPI0026CB4F37